MQQMSSFPVVPDLHGSNGVTVSRIDIVDDDGEKSRLYTIVYVKGKIRVALRFRRLV